MYQKMPTGLSPEIAHFNMKATSKEDIYVNVSCGPPICVPSLWPPYLCPLSVSSACGPPICVPPICGPPICVPSLWPPYLCPQPVVPICVPPICVPSLWPPYLCPQPVVPICVPSLWPVAKAMRCSTLYPVKQLMCTGCVSNTEMVTLSQFTMSRCELHHFTCVLFHIQCNML